MTLVLLISMGLLGLALFRLVAGRDPRWTIPEVAALSFGLGTGLVVWILHLRPAAGGTAPLQPITWTLPGVGIVVLAWNLFKWKRRRIREVRPRLDTAMILGGAALVLASAVAATAVPLRRHDAVAHYGLKARILHLERDPSAEGFTDPDRPHFHRKYPLLIPLLEATLATPGVDVEDGQMKLLFPAFFAALLLVIYGSQRAFASRRHALIFTVLLAAAPLIASARWGAASGMGDLPFAFFVSAAALALAGGETRHFILGGLLAGFAMLTKREGAVAAAAILGALVLEGIITRRGRQILGIPLWALAVALVTIPWFVIRSRIAAPDHGETEWYLAHLGLERASAIGRRIPVFLWLTLGEILDVRRWLFLWPTVLLGAGSVVILRVKEAVRSLRKGAPVAPSGIRFLVLYWWIHLLAYGAIYLVTPNHMSWQMSVSLPRLLIHLLPVGVFITSYAVHRVVDLKEVS